MSMEDSRPLRTCDIVMKGGITSGVVYPRAITKLAERFVFKNIGGSSAGAIAAAATAAAEFRRQQSGDLGGFETLEQLPALLVQQPDDSGRSRLFQFFQPSERTRRLFDVLTFGMGGQPKGEVVRKALREFAGWAVGGALPGLILTLTSYVNGSSIIAAVWITVGVVLAVTGAVVGTAVGFILEVVREIPKHDFGLCSGMSAVKYSNAENAPGAALTVWLTGYLNQTAGLAPEADPLTFGQLWRAGSGERPPDERTINLEMMTTNLTHRRPFRLPFRDDEDLQENSQFFFRADEFRRYFPESVVQWMIGKP